MFIYKLCTMCTGISIYLCRYLENRRLCEREPVQSFIEEREDVNGICGNNGRRLNNAQNYARNHGQNLCISIQNMEVYDVESQRTNNGCTVSRVSPGRRRVTVACNTIENQNVCRPVHYESDQGQTPDNVPCRQP